MNKKWRVSAIAVALTVGTAAVAALRLQKILHDRRQQTNLCQAFIREVGALLRHEHREVRIVMHHVACTVVRTRTVKDGNQPSAEFVIVAAPHILQLLRDALVTSDVARHHVLVDQIKGSEMHFVVWTT